MKEDNVIQFEPKENANIFKDLPDLAGNLVKELPKPRLILKPEKIKMFYKILKRNTEEFEFLCIMEDITNKLLGCLYVSKAPDMDEISSRFVKDSTEVLTKTICGIINLLIKWSAFPDKCEIAKLIPLFKKGLRRTQKFTDQGHYFLFYAN